MQYESQVPKVPKRELIRETRDVIKHQAFPKPHLWHPWAPLQPPQQAGPLWASSRRSEERPTEVLGPQGWGIASGDQALSVLQGPG